MGMFSSSEAREAFKGVTRLGYNGRTSTGLGRQDALNFVYNGKKDYGASVDESLLTLQETSKTTQVSLSAVTDEMKKLSDTAGQFGVNAQMARSQLVGLFDQALGGGYGSGSLNAASSIQDTLTSYGRSYANVTSNQLSPGYARYAAAQAGMTYGQLVALQKTNPQAAASVRSGAAMAGAASALTPQMQQFLSQRIKAYGGKVDESISLQIASEFLSNFARQMDPDVLRGQLSALTGMDFPDPDHAIGWVVMQMAGATEAANAAGQKSTSLSGVGTLSPSDAKARGLWSPVTSSTTTTAGSGSGVGFLGASTVPGTKPTTTKDYAVGSDGRIDPVIAALQKKFPDPSKQTVYVHTASGLRAVTLAEAMTNHRNELASGTAMLANGQSIADVLGGAVDPTRDWSSEARAVDKSGVSAVAWKAAMNPLNPAGATSGMVGTGTVTVDLSADAKRLLTVMDATGIAGAAGQAAPPSNPYAANPSLTR
jgi:hypothetical protein